MTFLFFFFCGQGISDPGTELAAACAAEGIRVVPVPGACAAVAAVSVAGFPSREFVFFGFVSGKRGSAVRQRKLTEIAQVISGRKEAGEADE